MPDSVKTFSLRFNNLSSNSKDELINWIASNDHIETLYVMECGLSNEKDQTRLETSWNKKLVGHSIENFNNTYIRVSQAAMEAYYKEQEA